MKPSSKERIENGDRLTRFKMPESVLTQELIEGYTMRTGGASKAHAKPTSSASGAHQVGHFGIVLIIKSSAGDRLDQETGYSTNRPKEKVRPKIPAKRGTQAPFLAIRKIGTGPVIIETKRCQDLGTGMPGNRRNFQAGNDKRSAHPRRTGARSGRTASASRSAPRRIKPRCFRVPQKVEPHDEGSWWLARQCSDPTALVDQPPAPPLNANRWRN